MNIGVRTKGKVQILDLSGKLVIGEDRKLGDQLRQLLDGGSRLFVLNLAKVPWMDSSGLGEMVACAKRVREREGKVVLCSLNKKLSDLLIMTYLDRVFEIHADEAEALASFAS